MGHHFRNGIRVSRVVKRCAADEQLVQRTTETVQISPVIDEMRVRRLFGSHIIDGPHNLACAR